MAAAEQWDAAFNAGDAGRLSQVYARDAVILPAGGEQAAGREGAEKVFGGFIKSGVKNHKITVQDGKGDDDAGYAYGLWQADAEDKRLTGRWVNVLRRVDGQWRIALHIWNVDQ